MPEHEHFTNKIVKTFLDSNLSLIALEVNVLEAHVDGQLLIAIRLRRLSN